MKLFPSLPKIAVCTMALGIAVGTAVATSLPASAEWDPTTLETEVSKQKTELEQHEERITTLEGQTKTVVVRVAGAEAAVAQVATKVEAIATVLPTVVPAPSPTPAPKPAKVETSVEHGYAREGLPGSEPAFSLTPGGATADRVYFNDGSIQIWRTAAGARTVKLYDSSKS